MENTKFVFLVGPESVGSSTRQIGRWFRVVSAAKGANNFHLSLETPGQGSATTPVNFENIWPMEFGTKKYATNPGNFRLIVVHGVVNRFGNY